MQNPIYQQIHDLQKQIEAHRNSILELRAQLQPEPVSDYTLLGKGNSAVSLSSLFDERNELLVIHNMGKRCAYCTLWADGFNGFYLPINDRVPFVVVSPDTPDEQQAFAESRGWKFKMLSAQGTSFIKDLGFEPEPGKYWPGVSALIMKEGKIYRASYDFFGPGDFYCSPFHLFDLLPNRDNNWRPKFKYNP
ncbi:MAG: DUF899 family protein [Chitinophagales bacterium]